MWVSGLTFSPQRSLSFRNHQWAGFCVIVKLLATANFNYYFQLFSAWNANFVLYILCFVVFLVIYHKPRNKSKAIGRSTLNGQRCMKSLSSVCPSLIFLKIGWLDFSDVLHDDSWPWYLVTDKARLLKNILVTQIWAKWFKIGAETRFFPFCQV